MKKVFIIQITILVIGFCYACKTNEVPKKQSYVTISGTIKGNGGVRDSIRILFGGLIPETKLFGTKDTTIYTGSNGAFLFKSKDIQEPTRITISSYKKRAGENSRRWGDALRNFLVEPGDNIHIEIDESKEEHGYGFSGTGSEKFKVQWQNFQSGYKVNRREIQRRYGSKFASLSNKVQIADSLSNIQIRALETVKDSLSDRVFKIMKADIYGENGVYLKTFVSNMHVDTCSTKQIQLYRKLFDESLNTNLPSDILASSPYYIMFLSNMAIAQLQLGYPENPDYRYEHIYAKGFSDLCQIWRNQYSGVLREKLLLYNLQSLNVQDTYGIEECLQMSYDLIKTPELKAIIDTMYGRQIRGATAFNFNLPNTEGTMVRLSDFKGKVVYLDIWFTGCSGCLYLAKEVDHQVYPLFKDNPDVVFVSISGDKSKTQWLESVESERYGLKEYVNLYTGGLGFKHDFTLYYGIKGGPTTMIIDREGRIYSSAPPKHGKSKELVALINEALGR